MVNRVTKSLETSGNGRKSDWFKEAKERLLKMREIVAGTVHSSLDELTTLREGSEILATIADMEGITLRQIDTALEEIEDGTYGTCAQCGMAIPKARMHAMPTTSLCVGCKAKDERVGEHYNN